MTSRRLSRFTPPALAVALLLGQTATLAFAASPSADHAPSPGPAAGKPVAADTLPAFYLNEWKKAKNRKHCAPVAFVGLSPAMSAGATPRRADFSDGWAVAYDIPGQRSAYGVAGTGSVINDGDTYRFTLTRRWPDGSVAHYGLEGGNGPGHLAYLQVKGQSCMYNVWSKRGQEHLEYLLDHLRQVRTPTAGK